MGFIEDVNKKIKALIETAEAPWQWNWDPGDITAPVNPVSGYQFSGFNFIQLATENKRDPRWCTFKQCQDQGWRIRKGAKATLIAFWGQNRNGQMGKQAYRYVHVFNGADISGIPERSISEADRRQACMKAKALLDKHPGFEYNKAEMKQYPSQSEFYAAVFKRLSYWAAKDYMAITYGIPNEDKLGEEAIIDEAKQTMRSSMANYMLSAKIGLGLKSYPAFNRTVIEDLRSDPKEIFRSCYLAEKITAYLEQGRDQFLQKQKTFSKTNVRPPAVSEKAVAGIGY